MRRTWPLWAAAVASALYLALIAVGQGTFEVRVTDLLQVVTPALAAATCALAARRSGPGQRWGWGLASAACAAWAAGQVAWTVYEWAPGSDVPFPSLADAGYLTAIPLMAAAIVLLGPRTSPATRVRITLDGLLTATCLLFVMWVVVIGPTYREGGEGALAQGVALAYPLGDLVMAASILSVGTRAPRRDLAIWGAVGLGIAGWAMADSGFAYLTATGAYGTGDWIDVGWFGGFAFVAAAGVMANTQPLADEVGDALRLTNLGVPWVATALALGLAAFLEWRDHALEAFLVWTGVAFVAVILTRQLVSQVEIRRLNDSLQGANVGLAAALEERKRAEQTRTELEAARRQSKFQTDFLNSAAHELATPMTPIRIELTMLDRLLATTGSEEARRHVAILERNTARLSNLVQDILASARLDLGKLALHRQPTDLAHVARQIVEDFSAHATNRQVDLQIERQEPTVADADPRRMSEVLSNLVSNAIKFTPAGGQVRVAVFPAGLEASVRVSDSGLGFTADQAAQLFQPFTAVHEHGPTVESTGLGLYVSKGIVEEHGGRIWAESPGPAQGSSFIVRLPLAAGASPAAGPA